MMCCELLCGGGLWGVGKLQGARAQTGTIWPLPSRQLEGLLQLSCCPSSLSPQTRSPIGTRRRATLTAAGAHWAMPLQALWPAPSARGEGAAAAAAVAAVGAGGEAAGAAGGVAASPSEALAAAAGCGLWSAFEADRMQRTQGVEGNGSHNSCLPRTPPAAMPPCILSGNLTALPSCAVSHSPVCTAHCLPSLRYEEDDFSDEDYEPGGGGSAGPVLAPTAADLALPGGPQRIVVEAILAWRWPPALPPATLASIPMPPAEIAAAVLGAPVVAQQQPAAPAAGAAPVAAAAPADGATPMAVDTAMEPKQEPGEPAAAAAAPAAEQPGGADAAAAGAAAAAPAAAGEQQAEAASSEMDAVAALLAASDAPAPAAVPGLPPGMPSLPLPSPADGAAAAAAALAAAAAASAPAEPEYLVKYVGRSHAHNEWVPESTLLQIAKRKVGWAGGSDGARLRAGLLSCVRLALLGASSA